jgi:uncharacterized protein YqgV (UPF0045/DUF77 family)
MRITAEMSLYPLHGDFVTDIRRFILDLRARPGLEIVTNQLSTQVRGELPDVMAAVAHALEAAMAAGHGTQVLVAKFIGADLPIATVPRIE